MRFRRPNLWVSLVILALLLYAGISLVRTQAQITAAKQENQELQAEADALQSENDALRYAVEHADDPEVLADAVRDKLGLVKSEDKVLVVEP